MRVVVLADHKSERDALTRMLARTSYRTEVVGTEAAALATIMQESPHIVLFSMPNKGGADLVRRLLGADSSGQSYLLALCDTAPAPGELASVLEAGAQDFLRRPVVQAELLERLKAPRRLVRWAKSLTTQAFDLSAPVDVAGLRAWNDLGTVVAADFSEIVGAPFEVRREWPRTFVGEWRAAMIPMSLAGDQLEVRIWIVADAVGLNWLKVALLGGTNATAEVADDALRELANTAGGALKRAALKENVSLTTGIPITETITAQGPSMTWWTLAPEGAKSCLALVGEIRELTNQRVAASDLSEGMIPAHDVRNDDGVLLVAAGTRLTATSAARLSKLLGRRFFLEVAPPS